MEICSVSRQEIILPDEAAPRFYTREEQIEHILGEVSSGRSLWTVLEHDEGMPSHSVFWRWHMADEDLRDNLARARLNGVEAHMEKAVHIAETPQMGSVVTIKPHFDKEGNLAGEITEVRKEDMLGHRKLQIETLLKRAQMIAPRKYGPKMDLTSGGEKIEGATGDVAARAAAILALAKGRKGRKDGK
jgi:hypothetical protein